MTLGNTAGVAVGQIFVSADGPRYIRGLSVAMGLAAVALLMVSFLMVGMSLANRRRAARIAAAELAGNPLAPVTSTWALWFKRTAPVGMNLSG